jgi:hypothetical protein
VFGCDLVESLALAVMCFAAGKGLPSLDRCIDVPRVQLYAVTASAGLLSSENRRSAPHEGIEHNVVAPRAV